MARVLDDGEAFKAFPVTNGVKQGCVLAPMVFSIMLSAMLSDAFRDCEQDRRKAVRPQEAAGCHEGEGDSSQRLSLRR